MFPLTVLPLIAYNLVGYGLSGADPWANRLFSLPMPSGVRWTLTMGDLLIIFAIVVLFISVMRTARRTRSSILSPALSLIVAAVYVIEFMVAGAAAYSVFFILTLIAVFDAIAGFKIAPRPETAEDSYSEEIDDPV